MERLWILATAHVKLLWIVRNEHLNWSHRVVFHSAASTWNSAAPLHLHSRCREDDQLLVCMLLRCVWPSWESETSKGRIVHLRSERRRNCSVHWAVANYIHTSPTWHNVRTRDIFVGNYCIFQVRIECFIIFYSSMLFILLFGYIAGFFTFAENVCILANRYDDFK